MRPRRDSANVQSVGAGMRTQVERVTRSGRTEPEPRARPSLEGIIAMKARRMLNRGLAPLLATGLAISMAACGSSSGGGGGQSPSASSSFDAMSAADLAAAAAKEGSLTWYTTFADDDVQPIVAAFNKQYPNVKVNALRLSADKIPPRIITEQRGGKYNADVVSGDSPQVAQLLQIGALQPYTPKDIAPLPAGLDLPKGYEGYPARAERLRQDHHAASDRRPRACRSGRDRDQRSGGLRPG